MADDDTGLRLNLGCGTHPMEGWVNIDQPGSTHADRQIDLNRMDRLSLPYDTSTVDEVYGSHVIEHITNVLPLMEELWRVCKPDARATFACPYGSSDDAWENPTHVRPMFVGSWGFYGQPNYWREDYGYKGDWVVEEVRLRVTRERWDNAIKQQALTKPYDAENLDAALLILNEHIHVYRNVVSEMVATLRANKPARVADRELQEDKTIIIEVLEPVDAWTNLPREVGRLVMGTKREGDT